MAGNRLTAATNGVTVTRSYDAANQVVGWSYDAAGNLLSDGTTSYTYDTLNQVLTNSGTTNTYNGDGVLVAQTTGGVTTWYTQDLAAPLSQILSDGTTTYLYGTGAERLASVTNGLRTWYGTDALGNVRMLQSPSGAALARRSYDPWGQVQGPATDRFGFTGELQQGSLEYLRARLFFTHMSGRRMWYAMISVRCVSDALPVRIHQPPPRLPASVGLWCDRTRRAPWTSLMRRCWIRGPMRSLVTRTWAINDSTAAWLRSLAPWRVVPPAPSPRRPRPRHSSTPPLAFLTMTTGPSRLTISSPAM